MSKTTRNRSATNLIEGDISSILRKMTMPMVVGMIMMMSFGLIDTFFVSLLGTQPLAAISFTFPVTFTVISLNIGLGIGTSAIIGKLQGSGKIDESRQYASSAMVLSFVLVGTLAVIGYLSIDGIFHVLNATDELMPYIHDYMNIWYLSSVFLALPMVGNSVLRASGDTRTPSIIMATGGAINAALDPVFIFGLGPIPAMGIQGAALATLIAWLVGASWVIWLLAVKRKMMLPRLLTLAELKTTCLPILKIALPAAGANMLTPIAGGVMTAVVAKYGATAVAAWGVGNRLESIASIVVLALSMSLPPIISQNVGANRFSRVEQAYRLTLKFVIVWQLMIFVVLWLLSGWIGLLFGEDPKVGSLITLFLMVVPLGYGLQGVVILTNSSLNAMHRPVSALVLSIIRLFVFYVPVSYLASLFYDLPGLFAGVVGANLCMALVSYIYFNRVLSRHRSKLGEQIQQ